MGVRFELVLLIAIVLLATATDAKKFKPTAKPFKGAVPHIKCQVCKAMVTESATEAEAMRANTTRPQPIREDEYFSEVIELVCNPFAEVGWWVRRGDIQVSDDLENIGVVFGEDYGKCRRDCYTIAEACNAALDSDAADDLSSMLYKGKKTAEQMQNIVCKSSCKLASKKKSAANRKIKKEWGSEEFEEIDEKQLQIEEMMDRVARNRKSGEPGMDFYSRDEMTAMRTALEHGDVETLQEIDPSASALSEDDLTALKQEAIDVREGRKGPEIGFEFIKDEGSGEIGPEGGAEKPDDAEETEAPAPPVDEV